MVLLTSTGEEHGLIAQYPNACAFDDFKNADPSIKESLKKRKKDDAKLVKARYINHQEGPLGRLVKPYCKYAGDPIQQWKFVHGYVYEVPLGLVNEVNEVEMPVRAGLQSVDGKDVNNGAPVKKDTKTKIHEFVSTEF